MIIVLVFLIVVECFARPSSCISGEWNSIKKLNSTKIGNLNRLPHFWRTFDWPCRIIRRKCYASSKVEFLPCGIWGNA